MLIEKANIQVESESLLEMENNLILTILAGPEHSYSQRWCQFYRNKMAWQV